MISTDVVIFNIYSMRQNIQYWNEKTNNITLFHLWVYFSWKKVTYIQQLHNKTSFSLLGTRAAGAIPRRQTHMRVRDARVSVLYMLAHTVFVSVVDLGFVVFFASNNSTTQHFQTSSIPWDLPLEQEIKFDIHIMDLCGFGEEESWYYTSSWSLLPNELDIS
jgi:hypothetical protein